VLCARVAHQDLDGGPPYNATPAFGGSVALDVGQLCGPFAAKHGLPRCPSRVWKVAFSGSAGVPSGVGKYAVATLRGWDASNTTVINSHFFGGIDGIRWKSNNGKITNSTIASTYMEVTPLQYFLEGPPQLHSVSVHNVTFTACDGKFGTSAVNCSLGIPVWNNAGGFCRGNGGKGFEAAGTCTDMHVSANQPYATDCCSDDAGAVATCCSACMSGGRRCLCC
jgi:hypothetical protein